MAPDMQMVDSSNVEAIGYDVGSRELHIQFTSGRLYVYLDVEEFHYLELLGADSKGSYLNREVKPRYECEER